MSKHKKVKRLTLEDVEWELICEPEDVAVRGNAMASGDDEVDRKQERWVYDQLRAGNQWAWCHVIVKGKYEKFEESTSLGRCSYLSEKDFKQPGGYYDDMRNEVLGLLREEVQYEAFKEKLNKQRLRAAKLLRLRADKKPIAKMDWDPLAGAMRMGATALEELVKKGS